VPAERKVLALLIANEWENQKEIMKVSGLPMVSCKIASLTVASRSYRVF
jgi:chaperone required for assembly of F1-ATPase